MKFRIFRAVVGTDDEQETVTVVSPDRDFAEAAVKTLYPGKHVYRMWFEIINSD